MAADHRRESGPQPSPKQKWLGKSVLALGLVSFFTDASSEMIIPLLPILLIEIGAGATGLALIEGIADAVASVMKLLAGRWSDRQGRRRVFLLAGYGLSGVVRPCAALIAASWQMVAIRALDRVGKGLRSSPRDALLAELVAPEQRNRAFGFHRAMDHAGAIAGPLLAMAALLVFSPRLVIGLAAIPAMLAFLVLVYGLPRETPRPLQPQAERLLASEAKALRRLLIPLGVFALGRGSELFLLWLAGERGAPLASLPLLWIELHLVKSLSSLLVGGLAVRIGARQSVLLGYAVHVLAYCGFALVQSAEQVAWLLLFYGLHYGLSEAPEKTLVASSVAAQRRGTAFGYYHLLQGFAALPAGLLLGLLWDHGSRELAFFTAAGLAALGGCWLVVLVPRRGDQG